MKVTASPCLVENEDISLEQAVEKMNFFEVNYILLKSASNTISGIFTERDLLRSVNQIMDEGGLDSPVSKFMTKGVKTLSLGLIQTAPEYLRDHKLRHLPITILNNETKNLEVCGIVTTEGLYEQIVKLRGLPDLFPSPTNTKKRRMIGVASPDGSLWKLFDKVFSDSPQIDVKRYRFAELQSHASLQSASEECDALMLDIDDAPDRYWQPTVKFMAKNVGVEYLAIALTEKKTDPRMKPLEELERNGVLSLVKKPMDISKVVMDLERFWSGVK